MRAAGICWDGRAAGIGSEEGPWYASSFWEDTVRRTGARSGTAGKTSWLGFFGGSATIREYHCYQGESRYPERAIT